MAGAVPATIPSLELHHKGYDGAAVRIPKLGLGVYQVPPHDAVNAVTQALKSGYRHIDTAALYRNEQAVGGHGVGRFILYIKTVDEHAFLEHFSKFLSEEVTVWEDVYLHQENRRARVSGKAVRDSGIPREEVFVTTKVWNSDQGYQSTLRAFNRSLQDLGLGYVDLYLVHSPMPVERRLDTWRAMEEILKSGKAKAIGVSNYGVHHLQELFAHCTIRPSVNQIQLHPFNTMEKLVKFCESEGIVLQAYSPLTQGHRLHDPTLVQVAKAYNKSPAQILIRWCLQKNFVVLPKSVTPQRIVENAQVFDFNISDAHMAELDSLNNGWVCGWDPTTGR